MFITQLERWKYEREPEIWECNEETDDEVDDDIDRYGTIEDIAYSELMDED